MVLSDLILGWSQLVTGHADSLIISYLKKLHVRFSLNILLWNELWRHILMSKDVIDVICSPCSHYVQCGWFWDQFPMGKMDRYSFTCNEKVPAANTSKGLRNVLLMVVITIKRWYIVWKSYMWYLYYPWYMQICVFFLPVQVNTPAGLKGQEVTRYLLPSTPPIPPNPLPTLWPNLMAEFVKVWFVSFGR